MRESESDSMVGLKDVAIIEQILFYIQHLGENNDFYIRHYMVTELVKQS